MERKAWTDERLDDMAERGQDQFELLVRELQETRVEFRTEMREMRREMRAEMQELRRDLREEMQKLRRELREEMQELRHELRGEMHEMRGELRVDIGALNGELHAVRRDMIRGSIALFGVLLAMYATALVSQVG